MTVPLPWTRVELPPNRYSYLSPDGTPWVSQGAYEQAIKLDKAQKRIRELEEELAAATFPVEGMSGCFDDDNGMDVWVTGAPESKALNFRMGRCFYCNGEWPCLYLTDDFCSIHVCPSCLAKMFRAFGEKVTSNGANLRCS